MMKRSTFIIACVFAFLFAPASGAAVFGETPAFFAFPEVREKPIRWHDAVSEEKFTAAAEGNAFRLEARPGEWFMFQVGVLARDVAVEDVRLTFSDFRNAEAGVPGFSAEKLTCYNLAGVDISGKPFTKNVTVAPGRTQAFWIGMDLENVPQGVYTGSVSITAGGETQTLPLAIHVSGEALGNHGYDEGKRLARLNWLNSTAGLDENVTKGYIPVAREGRTLRILGRELTISENGLPAAITSYFTGANEFLSAEAKNILARPAAFIVEKEDGEIIRFTPGEIVFLEQTPAKIVWRVMNTADACDLECTGRLDFDGFAEFRLKLRAKTAMKVKDIRLETPVREESAEYMMGLNHEGGLRTPDWAWKWDASKNQDMLWLGSVNAGLRIKWKAENYVRPLVNVYYGFGPLKMPPSWENAGAGGVTVKDGAGERAREVTVTAYSGPREITPGETLDYDFELLITPLKTLNREDKYLDRYYHGGPSSAEGKIAGAKQVGANVIVVHHAEELCPFINYPFIDEYVPELKAFAAAAHAADIRLKFYYTTRELTKNIPEFFAFFSLDGEVIFPGPGNETRTVIQGGGPHPWLIENLREKYIPAWSNGIGAGKFQGELDLSVITVPDSRLNNFYIAGLEWMVTHLDLDGVYIDDSALDRGTLCRARKVIDAHRPNGKIDLHSWNHFNGWAGFTNCLNLYMDLIPYLDLLWIGEERDYNRSPDHWLVEVSGIPFGVSGQMLQGGGNPWRGMIYGITNRAAYSHISPEHLWKFFDAYDFAHRIMLGYWDNVCPATCAHPSVKATVYRGEKDTILAVANWNAEDVIADVTMDWKKLGIPSETAEIFIPEIPNFQDALANVSLKEVKIPGGKGFLVVIRKKAP